MYLPPTNDYYQNIMIAIAKIGGHQALVSVGETIEVDKLDVEVGKKVQFETLLVSEEDGSQFQIGTPFIEGLKIEAKVLEHGRGKKIRVFKMKPRKRYRRTLGHRQDYSVIEIVQIGNEKALKPATKKAEPKASEKKAPANTSSKKAIVKKPATKKPASVKKTSKKS